MSGQKMMIFRKQQQQKQKTVDGDNGDVLTIFKSNRNRCIVNES